VRAKPNCISKAVACLIGQSSFAYPPAVYPSGLQNVGDSFVGFLIQFGQVHL
jgi:hypothetical protein